MVMYRLNYNIQYKHKKSLNILTNQKEHYFINFKEFNVSCYIFVTKKNSAHVTLQVLGTYFFTHDDGAGCTVRFQSRASARKCAELSHTYYHIISHHIISYQIHIRSIYFALCIQMIQQQQEAAEEAAAGSSRERCHQYHIHMLYIYSRHRERSE